MVWHKTLERGLTDVVHCDVACEVGALESVTAAAAAASAFRRPPPGPAVNQANGAAVAGVNEQLGRVRMVLDMVHIVPVDNLGDCARVVGAEVELEEGPVGRGGHEQGGVVRVRREGHDGILVVAPGVAGRDASGVEGIRERRGGGFEVVGENGVVITSPVRQARLCQRCSCSCGASLSEAYERSLRPSAEKAIVKMLLCGVVESVAMTG